MVKLKQIRFIPYTIVVTTLLFFSACVDKNYNLDDDNLDKSGVLSPNGGTVPFGNVEKIMLFDRIKEQFTGDTLVSGIDIDDDGTIFVYYKGDFVNNFEMPTIEAPKIAQQIDVSTTVGLPSQFPIIGGNITLPMGGFPIPITNGSAEYQMANPEHNGKGWAVEVDSIGFAKCDLYLTISFEGITFVNTGAGKLHLLLTTPPDIILPPGTGNPIEKIIPIDDIRNNGNQYTLLISGVSGYKYSTQKSEINYDVFMETGSGNMIVTVPTGEFAFKMFSATEDIEPSIFKGAAKVTQNIEGSISDFSSFFDSFKDDVLKFDNPILGLELETNIGVNFNINADLIAKDKSGQKGNVVFPAIPLAITKPNSADVSNLKSTSFWLFPTADNILPNIQMYTDKLLYPLPYSIDYDLTLNADDPHVALFFGKDNDGNNLMKVKGKYTLKLPFSFSEMDITVSDTIMDVFTQDIYDNFFKDSKATDYLEVRADSVNIHFPGAETGKVTLTANATILKEDGTPLDGVKITPATLTNGNGANPLVIRIEGLDKMENAKHLKLIFSANAGSLKLTKDDYIQIRKLKFSTNRGYHFEL